MSLPPDLKSAANDPSRRFGRYVLGARLGKGGMGEVWRAWDTQLNRWVALKFLVGPPSEEYLLRFQREAQAVAQLEHPGIAAIYDSGDVNGRAYIAMQLVDGKTADNLKPDVRTALSIVADAALAVQFAHERDIVHRDIKPSNIMVDKEGRTFVLDFGIARIRQGVDAKFSQTGLIMGTPPFMSPEQVNDSTRISPRSDVYSLGATLYALLTGRAPFTGKTVDAILMAVLHDEPYAPRSLRSSIPYEVETIVLRAMDKNPNQRYFTAKALAEDIGHYLDGEPIQAHRPSIIYRFRKHVAKRKAMIVVAGATAGVALMIAIAAYVLLLGRSYDDHVREARRALDAGDWHRALAECDRASALRTNPEVAALARDARAKIDAAKASQWRTERHNLLLEKLRPIDALIIETRPLFYVQDMDIPAQLRNIEKALDELAKLANDPNYVEFGEAWRALGLGRYFTGDGARAEEALLRAERSMPNDALINYTLARIAVETRGTWALGRTAEPDEQAVARMYRASQGAPKTLEQHVFAAFKAVAERRWTDAISLAREGLQTYGTEMGTEEFWLVIGGSSDNDRDAVEALTKAIARKPHHALARYMRGEKRRLLGSPREAVEDYDAVIRINPRFTHAYEQRGGLRFQANDPRAAMEDFDKALALDPRSYNARFNRALCRLALQNNSGALEDLDAALALRTTPEVLMLRGEARVTAWEFAGAIADLEQALKVTRDDWPHRERAERAMKTARAGK